MIKAVARGENGRALLVLGLTFDNLDKLREQAGDGFMKIEGVELNLPIDVIIFAGATEADLVKLVPIGPETNVHVSTRLKQ